MTNFTNKVQGGVESTFGPWYSLFKLVIKFKLKIFILSNKREYVYEGTRTRDLFIKNK